MSNSRHLLASLFGWKMGLTSLRSSFPSARRGGTSELSRKELFHNFFCFYIPPLHK